MKRYIYNFLKNIKCLFECSIKERERENKYLLLQSIQDFYQFELLNGETIRTQFNILDEKETLDLLLTKPKSFCRFGDGETDIINGKSIPFQVYDEKLAKNMLEILKTERNDLYVGINYYYFHSVKQFSELNRKYYWLEVPKHRDFLIQNCNWNKQYINAGFNQIYQLFESYDFVDYFNKIKLLFKDKRVVLFCGKGILDKLEYDVFELAKSKQIIYGPSRNAFSQYDELMEKALQFDKTVLFCFILGPTSKIMVSELSKLGYCAWDIGHLAKDYNSFMKKEVRTEKSIADFFAPD